MMKLVGIATPTSPNIVILENRFLDIKFQWVLELFHGVVKKQPAIALFERGGIQSGMHNDMDAILLRRILMDVAFQMRTIMVLGVTIRVECPFPKTMYFMHVLNT